MADPIETAEAYAHKVSADELRELAERFKHHPPSRPEVINAHEQVRAKGFELGTWLLTTLPPCPERQAAIEAVDLAVMHANAAIARTQLVRSTRRQETSS